MFLLRAPVPGPYTQDAAVLAGAALSVFMVWVLRQQDLGARPG